MDEKKVEIIDSRINADGEWETTIKIEDPKLFNAIRERRIRGLSIGDVVNLTSTPLPWWKRASRWVTRVVRRFWW